MSIQNLNAYVHGLLAGFHAGEPLEEPTAFQKALGQLAFDYTPEAIGRVDRLLEQVRQKLRPEYAGFMTAAENRSFLRLLAFMVGEAVGRYRGAPCRWLNHEGLRVLLRERAITQEYPDRFGTSVVCEIEGEGLFFPLAAMEDVLFGESGTGVLAAADVLMRRALSVPVLSDPGQALPVNETLSNDAAWQLGQILGSMACWCIDVALVHGVGFEPTLLQEFPGGKMLSSNMLDSSSEEAMRIGRSRLAHPEPGVAGQVLGYDGFIGLPRFRSDAILMEGVWHAGGGAALRAVLALPYRPQAEDRQLVLHDPRLLEFAGDAAATRRLRAGLFARLTVPLPTAPWPRYYLDENSEENLGGRRDAMPALPWESYPAPSDAIRLSDFSLQKLASAEPGYLDSGLRGAAWENDPLVESLLSFPTLLREGRVVWGTLVQANKELFEPGSGDRPADVVYSTDGSATPDLLVPLSTALFALRGQPPGTGDEALARIARYLDAETERAFGLPLPPSLAPGPGLPGRLPDTLRLSSLLVLRKHLPQGYLAVQVALPLLVSERRPGHVMIVPSRAWPPALLSLWQQAHRNRLRARWDTQWQALAAGKAEDEQELNRSADRLAQYAEHGVDLEAMRLGSRFGLARFADETKPPPKEWEWRLDLELRSRAERLLSQAETQRARGLPLPQELAQQAFAARATAQMVAMHIPMMERRRGRAKTRFPPEPDEIQYAALGMLVGCDHLALPLAELLITLWRNPRNFLGSGLLRPEVWAVFQLFAQHLQLELPQKEPFAGRPRLDDLLRDQAWKGATGSVRAMIEAACVEHTEQAPVGPFLGLPIALALILRLRELAGLPNPTIDHELLRVKLGSPGGEVATDFTTALDELCDPLVWQARARMKTTGYDEAEIRAAVLQDREPRSAGFLARWLPRKP